jgi:uncharacterized protein
MRYLPSLLLLFVAFSQAAPEFPALSGRVVDQAGLLSANFEQSISARLAAHEQATGNQVVVVTFNDLQGYPIEEFGYQLGRHWGIGQKDKNNGVLLIIAKQERKLRIEVGYGLEPVLTDAISSNIVHYRITPPFKRGQFEAGTSAGVDAIIAALGGEYKSTVPTRSRGRGTPGSLLTIILLFMFLGPVLLGPLLGSLGGRRRGSGFYPGGGFGRGGFGGGGGGFSGGGGSFGGGGASGGW